MSKHSSPTVGEQLLYVDGVPAAIRLRVDRRARRMILRVSPGGGVVLTTPTRRAASAAAAFAKSRQDWILAQLERSKPRPFAPGLVIPFQGEPYDITHTPDWRGVSRDKEARIIRAGGALEHLNRRMTDFLKREARDALTARVDAHVATLGVRRGRITVRDTASRWGSCSTTGALSFSWRLILAPAPILDYVAAHEAAHLVHLDHTPKFWRVVRELGVDADGARTWFAAHGAALHLWGRAAAPQ